MARRDVSLTVLDAIAQRIASTLRLDEVLSSVTGALVDELDAALARIWLVEGDSLVLRASSGLSTRVDGGHARVALTDTRKIAEIARSGVPIVTSALLDDPRIVDKHWVRDEKLASFAGYPLTFRGALLGVVAMFAQRPLPREELDALSLLARWAAIAVQNARLFAEVDALRAHLAAENAYLRQELAPTPIIGNSPAIRAALDQVASVAPTTSTVLLFGETGTGKELFARAIHEASPRRQRTLVKVNCAAVPGTLIESELFGHEKGAFTGADKRRVGRFELADGGTLFLDEVSELSLEAQAKLLRALQEREIEPVGAREPLRVDVRVVAATNRDLAEDVKSGRFRADLYYRLHVFPIEVPKLRERREDIPSLVDAFLRRDAARLGKTLEGVTPAALARLAAYDWPGNVRELSNVIERAAILARGRRIDASELPPLEPAKPSTAKSTPPSHSLEDVERTHIVEVLEQHAWVIEGAGGAAAALGLRPSTLRSRMEKLGVRRRG